MTAAAPAIQLINEDTPLLSTAAYISMPVLTLSTPVPYVGFAYALLLEIATAAQEVKTDKNAFERLAHDLCSLVLQIKAVCEHISPGDGILNEGSVLSLILRNYLEELKETLTEIRDFTKHRTNRSWKGYFDNKSDLAKIEEFRERVQQVLVVLRAHLNISVCRTLDGIADSIAHRQDLNQDELKEWGGVRRDSTEPLPPVERKTKNPFASLTVSSPPNPNPSSPMSFEHLLESSAIRGTVTSNNIKDDSNIITNNIHTSSTNCRNIYYNDTSYFGL
ncbi:hypothetical protein Moror_11064 [Moniliophthora roreri MCA 2997]|uniref:Fungal N-terminal domain-containing protein n=2 Tax=Moniliophthora roreri TaxID=221103 RepID=V2WS60_MONRO|nr:hypothetical protein Moror_11064 [Moniliophthora roreri MCA 2997]KAI3611909.1 hypothetical protein WG66_016280 [Moniliophthora roreri]